MIDDVTRSADAASAAGACKKRTPSEHTFAKGYTRHSECTCCEHAAERLCGMEDMLQQTISLIQGGFEMEATFEIDRVLCCLNDLIADGKAHEQSLKEAAESYARRAAAGAGGDVTPNNKLED